MTQSTYSLRVFVLVPSVGLVGVFKNTATNAMAHIPFRRNKDKKKPMERPHSIAVGSTVVFDSSAAPAKHAAALAADATVASSPRGTDGTLRPGSKSIPTSPQTQSAASSPRLGSRQPHHSANASPVQRRRAGTVGEMSARPLSLNFDSTSGGGGRHFGSDTNLSATTTEDVGSQPLDAAEWQRERARTEMATSLLRDEQALGGKPVPDVAEEIADADTAAAAGSVDTDDKHPMPVVEEADMAGATTTDGNTESERADSGSNSDAVVEKHDLTKISASICRWERRHPGSRIV